MIAPAHLSLLKIPSDLGKVRDPASGGRVRSGDRAVVARLISAHSALGGHFHQYMISIRRPASSVGGFCGRLSETPHSIRSAVQRSARASRMSSSATSLTR